MVPVPLRRAGVLCALLLLASAQPLWAQIPIDVVGGRDAAAREVLVRFRGPVSDAIRRLAPSADLDAAHAVGGAGTFLIRSRSLDATTLLHLLRLHPDVASVEPNYILRALRAPNDSRFGELWGLQNTGQPIVGVAGQPGADIGAVSAWDITTGSTANVVGVIDSGIDYTHPDLAANVWSAPAAFTVTVGGTSITCAAGTHGFNAITNTCDPRDDNGHGTHVSGTVGAVGNNGAGVVGVNWTASIMALKFLDANGNGSTAGAINAIEFAIQTKAAFASGAGANVRVLSASFGGSGFSQALFDQVNRANANGMLFVAAAGNSGFNNDFFPTYPASFNAPNVVAVAATTNTDGRSFFSNFGPASVDLGAPGVDILSTLPNNSYGYISGTSMATPHVSGAAALVLSKCDLDTAGLKAVLLNNVDPIPSLGGLTVTGGRLNVNRAIRACAPSPDFSLSASPASRTLAAGGSATYSVTVTPSNGFASTVTFSASGLPAGASASFNPTSVTTSGSSTMTVTAGADTPDGGFTLQITGASGSLSHGASVTLVVQTPRADVAIAKTASPNPVTVGNNVSYTLTATNNGPSDATSVTVSDTLPGSVSFISSSTTRGSCSGTSTVTCNLGTLPNGASATVTILVKTNAAGDVVNTATISGAETDPSSANNSASVTTTVQPAPSPTADLTITKTGSPNPVTVGNNVSYTLTATNNGPSDATNVTVSDSLPGSVSFVSVTPSKGSCSGTSTVSCNLGPLANGASAAVTLVVKTNATGNVTNTATVSATETDPSSANNSASVTTTVQAAPSADLAIAKTASPNPVTVGNNLTYTLTATNNGPSDATNVTVSDSLPGSVSFVSAAPSKGSCSGTATVTCNLGALANGASATVTLVVKTNAPGDVTNTATVSASEADPSSVNNSASVTVSVQAAASPTADLAMSQSGPSQIGVGGFLIYSLSVVNNGPSAATNVTVTDTLPAGLTLFFAFASSGTCTGTGSITCNLGSLANGASASVTILVSVAAATGTVTNTASVSASEPDPDSSNNTASVTTRIGF